MRDLLLRACRGEAVPRPPVWLMRQAGRYLPQYRRIRERTTFLDLCKTPELAAEVTVQPVDILGVDAAIVFADILLVLEAMGATLRFESGDGPRFPTPVRTALDVERLLRPDIESALGYVFSTIRQARSALETRVPVIGFAGSPWTLAAYVVEGGASTTFPHLVAWSYADPSGLRHLLDRIATVTLDYLRGQVAAGAEAIQIFDTWGGLLSAERWNALARPSIERILDGLPPAVPRILYVRDGSHLLESLGGLALEVISVDWKVSLAEARRRSGGARTLQGNLDPCALLAPLDAIHGETARLLADGAGGPHVVNLGHGILPQTPVENARAFVAWAQGRDYGGRTAPRPSSR
jgi:uroporphyrinogen decarboxylase